MPDLAGEVMAAVEDPAVTDDPPPIPVPRVNMTSELTSLPAPKRNSPNAAALASFSSTAGRPRPLLTRSRRGTPARSGRFGALMITPREQLSGPGAPIPTPSTSLGSTLCRPSRSPPACTMAVTISSALLGVGVWVKSMKRFGRPSPSTAMIANLMNVPPRSIPTQNLLIVSS